MQKTGRPHQNLEVRRKFAWCPHGCGKQVIGKYNVHGRYMYVCLVCRDIFERKPE